MELLRIYFIFSTVRKKQSEVKQTNKTKRSSAKRNETKQKKIPNQSTKNFTRFKAVSPVEF